MNIRLENLSNEQFEDKETEKVMQKNKRKVTLNPNKRPCVAENITFSVQRENEQWIRVLSK